MKDYFYGQTVPHEEDETGKRFYRFRIGALLAILFLLLTGCAAEPLPVCEKYGVKAAVSQDGEEGAFINMEGMQKLRSLILGLAAGTCRLPSNGTDA